MIFTLFIANKARIRRYSDCIKIVKVSPLTTLARIFARLQYSWLQTVSEWEGLATSSDGYAYHDLQYHHHHLKAPPELEILSV